MTKKEKFNLDASALFSTPEEEAPKTAKKKIGRPKSDNIVRDNSVQEGLPAELTRATLIVEVDIIEKLKDYAYTERISLKDVVNKALKDFADREIDDKKLLRRPGSKR